MRRKEAIQKPGFRVHVNPPVELLSHMAKQRRAITDEDLLTSLPNTNDQIVSSDLGVHDRTQP
jgi:hypothetical protein